MKDECGIDNQLAFERVPSNRQAIDEQAIHSAVLFDRCRSAFILGYELACSGIAECYP
jgi:hypothetical protein